MKRITVFLFLCLLVGLGSAGVYSATKLTELTKLDFNPFNGVTVQKAGVFAEPLPTYKSLEDRFTGLKNGFIGDVEKSQQYVTAETMEDYNSCVEQNGEDIKELHKLFSELAAILEYYRIVEGSEEAHDNFNKWFDDFKSKYPQVVGNVNDCYIKKIQGVKDAGKI